LHRFSLSEDARWITGDTVRVDGGSKHFRARAARIDPGLATRGQKAFGLSAPARNSQRSPGLNSNG